MPAQQTHIWYASYGSNLLEERFLCYIRGGRPEGSQKNYDGCTDKTLPLENQQRYISHEMYFARSSGSWSGGGVGFIKTNFDPLQRTLGRMYLITRDQFIEVIKQEIGTTDNLTLDYNAAMQNGSFIARNRSWYGNVLYLGAHNSIPIFTITYQDNSQPYTKPSEAYVRIIARGIAETYPSLTTQEIVNYLMAKGGIQGNYTPEEIRTITTAD